MKKVRFCILLITLFGLMLIVVSAQKKRRHKVISEMPRSLDLHSFNCPHPIDDLAILTVSKSGEYILGTTKVDKENLTKELDGYVCSKSPDKRIIYIEAQPDTLYSQIIDAFKAGRKDEVDTFGLKTKEERDSDIADSAIIVKVPAEEENPSPRKVKPNPLQLVVSLEADGKLKLNSKPETLEALTKKLRQTFLTRKQKRIYREGSTDIETTVFVYANGDVKFADVLNLVKEIKSAGADPIGMDVDDYFLKVVF